MIPFKNIIEQEVQVLNHLHSLTPRRWDEIQTYFKFNDFSSILPFSFDFYLSRFLGHSESLSAYSTESGIEFFRNRQFYYSKVGEKKHHTPWIKFLTASTYLSSRKITPYTIVACNSFLNGSLEPKLRTSEGGVYIGQNLIQKGCDPCEIKDILPLIAKNVSNSNSIQDAISVYLQLLSYHPFIDGNGRTARVIFQLILNKIRSNVLHIDLFRYFVDRQSHYNFINQYSINGVVDDDFIARWNEWGLRKKSMIRERVIHLSSRFNLHNESIPINRFFFGHPIVSRIVLEDFISETEVEYRKINDYISRNCSVSGHYIVNNKVLQIYKGIDECLMEQ